MILRSRRLTQIKNIIHGFGTCAEPIAFADVFEKSGPRWKQVHGTRVRIVTASAQECGEADGLICASPAIPVGIRTADCVPLLIAHKEGIAVSAIHAGWRGLFGGIIDAAWELLMRIDKNPTHWIVAIGPAVGPCCYEVSQDLLSAFESRFSRYPASEFIPRARRLDLGTLARLELASRGVSDLDHLAICTACGKDPQGNPIFFSYRREKEGCGRQTSLIMCNK